MDARTGKAYWSHETGGDMWGSPFVADGKVYIGTRRGMFWTLAAEKEKRVLSSIKLDSPISSTPTVAGGVLYVATMKTLYAVRKGEQ